MRFVAWCILANMPVWIGFAGQEASTYWESVFMTDRTHPASSGSNAYFVLVPGHRLVYGKGEEEISTTVTNKTKLVDGVETRVVESREMRDGQLTEFTRDYYAIDPATRDVYYFGEDVDVYKVGKIASHEGSWLSGFHGATFGLIMPGTPRQGMKFYQEQAPSVAMDRAELVAVGERVATPAGVFENCIHFVETSPLEKDVREHKWYAPGVGCVKDGNTPLVKVEQK